MRYKKGKICFSDSLRTMLAVEDIKRVHHDGESIEVTFINDKKQYLNYFSEQTARRDFNYTLIRLKKNTPDQVYV